MAEGGRTSAGRAERGQQLEERLRATGEAALASPTRLVALFESVSDGIVVEDRRGRIVLANRAAVGLLGLPAGDDLSGRALADAVARLELVDERGYPLPAARLPGARALAGEEAEEVVGFRAPASGEQRWALVKGTPILGADGDVELAVTVIHDFTERRRAEQRTRFLAEAGEALARSLDYRQTLAQVARLAVAAISDWCMVYVQEPGEPIRRIAVEHFARRHEGLLERLAEFPFDPEAEVGVPAVLRTGRPQLHPDADGALVASDVVGRERLASIADAFAIRSWMLAPLSARGRTLGVISFLSAESGRRFGEDDLELALELARRAALAVDNARLYAEAREAARRAGESLALLDALLASAPVGIGFLDRRLRFVRVNDHLAELDGVPPGEHLGRDLADVAPGLAAPLEPMLRRVLGTGDPVVHAEVEAGVAGAPRHWLTSYYPVETDDGERIGVGIVMSDITERKRAERERQELLAREQRARREAEARAEAAQALEFVADGVVLLDTAGVVRLWNPAAEAITGLRAARVVGRRPEQAIPGWGTLAPRVPIAAAGERPGARPETLPLELDGRELWLSISGVAFERGTVFAFRDLTEERGLEKLKSDFVSTVSHELRTPLAAIYGAALTLRRSDVPLEDEQRATLLGVIASESERLARIVNDVLWTSRIESGSLRVSIERCEASDVAESVVAAARLHAPANVAIELVLPDGSATVAADPDKTRQVLSNLVDNAVKYSPGGGRVEVCVERADGGVRFVVRDEGLGISASEHERVFEKFYRLDPDLARGIGGTGLGLYICRELVRRMDGRIWVESAPGHGSTFVVELPSADEVEAHTPRA